MTLKGQLFALHDDLGYHGKKLKLKKKKKTDEVVSKSSSADFYDDERPIQLSGPAQFQHDMAESWESASFDTNDNPVEEADYSVVSSYTNGDDEYQAQMDYEGNTYTEETPTNYQSMAAGDTDSPSFLDELIKPRSPNPDPLKALGDAVKGMSDDAFAADLASILEGNKVFDPEKKSLVGKDKVDEDFAKKLKEADAQRTPSSPGNAPANTTDKTQEDRNAIFEKIAQNMNYANSFDLGEFDMEQRFDAFDAEPPAPPKPDFKNIAPPINPVNAVKDAVENVLPFSTEEFIKDLDQISANSEAMEKIVKDKNWPAAPTGLLQPTAERTKQMFGTFEYEAIQGQQGCPIKIKGTWEADNISTVDIPQLTGKINGTTNKQIAKGAIMFNKKAEKQLQRLWKAWETAGLLDRVITFDGGFVPRFIKRKDGTCATTLSNHAWGSAFDINAAWNGLGDEPALVGQKGCTRELVEIANQHGFYWGGHFGTKDGMHFEVAKIIED
jgi:hypothetical protein